MAQHDATATDGSISDAEGSGHRELRWVETDALGKVRAGALTEVAGRRCGDRFSLGGGVAAESGEKGGLGVGLDA
jgi:hypothetical protein